MGRASRSRERVLGHLTVLRGLPRGGGPDAAFRERLRERLTSALPDEEPARPVGHRRPRHRRRRSMSSPLVSIGLVAAMMLSAVATYEAVPGDTLYPLKRAAESTLVRLSTDDVVRGERELVSAKTRAEEVAQLLGSAQDGPLVSKTLKDMEQSTRSGISRLRRAEPRSPKIDRFAEDQRNMVEPMLEQLDGVQQDQAVGYLDYIEGLVAPG
ncbi:DUF5667 domain-containing protein [Nonomuraea sp. LPB2021202275-12-8]|uniref:DUF5667 domain-containing protein n=1 Tax=Nonomuraea sp. LPB2021202275-12-8 TaxID=3120159 RepID=UPI00300D0BD2